MDPKASLSSKKLFSDLEDLVISNRHICDSFSKSQGSGQGRIPTSFLYKVNINQLLMELCQIDIGSVYSMTACHPGGEEHLTGRHLQGLPPPSLADCTTLMACFNPD